MLLAVVKGRATSTIKHETLEGTRLLLVETIDASGNMTDDPFLVIDKLGAGVNDRVMITSDGRGMREMIGDNRCPARWFTLGIVDQVSCHD